MYPVTERFKRTIRHAHTQVAYAELYHKGSHITNLPIISGKVTDDADALLRRRCTLELAGTEEVLNLLPASHPVNGGLWPLGNEIRVLAGVDYGDNTRELVPMGWFRVSKPSIKDSGGGITVALDGYDHSRTISRARFTMPYGISEGTLYRDALRTLLKSRMPTLKDDDFEFDDTPGYVTPELTFTQDDDPWKVAVDMGTSLGCELFWNGNRKIVLREEPNPLTQPSEFDYVEGDEATFVGISRELDEDTTYNGVIVSGESSTNEAPVKGEAWDTNPESPTYYDPDFPDKSEYGPVPFFITSQFVTTFEQAVAAAEANLLRVMGVVESVQFEGVSNFAHEANDVIRITRQRMNVDAGYVMSAVDMSLGGAQMSAVTRRRRVR